MTAKKQQSEQEGIRAVAAIMLRALILAAIVALVVSAAPPIASAGSSKKPPPRGVDVDASEVFELNTVKAPFKQRGIVVTKATDVSSRNRQRGAAGTSKKSPSARFLDQPKPVTS